MGESVSEASSIRSIQLAELGLLSAIVELCEKHHLRYVLYCGTLLGAIRHGGFIPWDDDVDIAMPLNDYRAFLEVAHELPDTYVIQTPYNTPHLSTIWAKGCIDGTTYMPIAAANIDAHWGVSIDIYPLIGEETTPLKRKAQSIAIRVAKYLRFLEYAQALSLETPGANVVEHIGKAFLRRIPFGPRVAISNFLLEHAMRDPSLSTRVGTIDAAPFTGKFSRYDWDDFTTATFENGEYVIPAQYDRILKIMYGNYHVLPQEKDRHPHMQRDGIVVRDTAHDYREYQRELGISPR